MSDNERLKKWLEEHDGEDYCHYCIYDSDCPHGVACYDGPTIEPPCCNYEPEEYLDAESILDDIRSEETAESSTKSSDAQRDYREHIANRFLKIV